MQRFPKQDGVTAGPDFGQAARLARLLDGLPPLPAKADSHINDAKYVRILLPLEYRRPIARFLAGPDPVGQETNASSGPNEQNPELEGVKFRICYHPDGHLCLVPASLAKHLRQEIRQELDQRGGTQRSCNSEIHEQEVTADAKSRLRISHVLTGWVGIQQQIVICREGWRVQIWAKERLDAQYKNPIVSHDSASSPSYSSTQRFSPGGKG